MDAEAKFKPFEEKMKAAGIPSPSILAFKSNFLKLLRDESVSIPEIKIEPVDRLARYDDLPARDSFDHDLLAQAAILKLNGGLGTSMGMDGAKSLLPLKGGDNFVDFIARHVLHLRSAQKAAVRLIFMNSFNTSEQTRAHLKRYPELAGDGGELELMQGRVPKVDARTHEPVRWARNPSLEWCPPGHGEIYPCLLQSGLLDRLLADGIRYAFVANADNRGAVLDPRLLSYFAESNLSFLMEVTRRTASDSKGGHLARTRSNQRLILREFAQCPAQDLESFQDIRLHRFFNTNNIWLRLDHLSERLKQTGGFLPLAMIKNVKTVDPQDRESPTVYQLETAMGAAIDCFDNAGAISVPRSRFAPVKTTADLFVLRSDAYEVTPNFQLVLHPDCGKRPPKVELDPRHYAHIDQLDHHTRRGMPSLRHCSRLRIKGPVALTGDVVFVGEVTLVNDSTLTKTLPAGTYKDTTVHL